MAANNNSIPHRIRVYMDQGYCTVSKLTEPDGLGPSEIMHKYVASVDPLGMKSTMALSFRENVTGSKLPKEMEDHFIKAGYTIEYHTDVSPMKKIDPILYMATKMTFRQQFMQIVHEAPDAYMKEMNIAYALFMTNFQKMTEDQPSDRRLPESLIILEARSFPSLCDAIQDIPDGRIKNLSRMIVDSALECLSNYNANIEEDVAKHHQALINAKAGASICAALAGMARAGYSKEDVTKIMSETLGVDIPKHDKTEEKCA